MSYQRKIKKNAFRRARKLMAAMSASLMLSSSLACANPVGPTNVYGTATASGLGTSLVTVDVPGKGAIINWQGFSIASGETTNFNFGTAGAAVLNRVIGTGGTIPQSVIAGIVSGNNQGKVFLVNPSGIVFSQGATINVPSLVASTLNISNSQFQAFIDNGQGSLNFSNKNTDGGLAAGYTAGAVQVNSNIAVQDALGLVGGSVVIGPGITVSTSGQNPNSFITISAGNSLTVGQNAQTSSFSSTAQNYVQIGDSGQTARTVVKAGNATNPGNIEILGGTVKIKGADNGNGTYVGWQPLSPADTPGQNTTVVAANSYTNDISPTTNSPTTTFNATGANQIYLDKAHVDAQQKVALLAGNIKLDNPEVYTDNGQTKSRAFIKAGDIRMAAASVYSRDNQGLQTSAAMQAGNDIVIGNTTTGWAKVISDGKVMVLGNTFTLQSTAGNNSRLEGNANQHSDYADIRIFAGNSYSYQNIADPNPASGYVKLAATDANAITITNSVIGTSPNYSLTSPAHAGDIILAGGKVNVDFQNDGYGQIIAAGGKTLVAAGNQIAYQKNVNSNGESDIHNVSITATPNNSINLTQGSTIGNNFSNNNYSSPDNHTESWGGKGSNQALYVAGGNISLGASAQLMSANETYVIAGSQMSETDISNSSSIIKDFTQLGNNVTLNANTSTQNRKNIAGGDVVVMGSKIIAQVPADSTGTPLVPANPTSIVSNTGYLQLLAGNAIDNTKTDVNGGATSITNVTADSSNVISLTNTQVVANVNGQTLPGTVVGLLGGSVTLNTVTGTTTNNGTGIQATNGDMGILGGNQSSVSLAKDPLYGWGITQGKFLAAPGNNVTLNSGTQVGMGNTKNLGIFANSVTVSDTAQVSSNSGLVLGAGRSGSIVPGSSTSNTNLTMNIATVGDNPTAADGAVNISGSVQSGGASQNAVYLLGKTITLTGPANVSAGSGRIFATAAANDTVEYANSGGTNNGNGIASQTYTGSPDNVISVGTGATVSGNGIDTLSNSITNNGSLTGSRIEIMALKNRTITTDENQVMFADANNIATNNGTINVQSGGTLTIGAVRVTNNGTINGTGANTDIVALDSINGAAPVSGNTVTVAGNSYTTPTTVTLASGTKVVIDPVLKPFNKVDYNRTTDTITFGSISPTDATNLTQNVLTSVTDTTQAAGQVANLVQNTLTGGNTNATGVITNALNTVVTSNRTDVANILQGSVATLMNSASDTTQASAVVTNVLSSAMTSNNAQAAINGVANGVLNSNADVSAKGKVLLTIVQTVQGDSYRQAVDTASTTAKPKLPPVPTPAAPTPAAPASPAAPTAPATSATPVVSTTPVAANPAAPAPTASAAPAPANTPAPAPTASAPAQANPAAPAATAPVASAPEASAAQAPTAQQ